MNNLVFTCGLPRSGKTTFCKKFIAKNSNFIYISADDLRYKVYGMRFFQDGENYVWATRKHMLDTLIEQGHNILIDETNTTKIRRSNILKLVEHTNYKVYCVHITTGIITCQNRAKEDKDYEIVPVIEKQNTQFQEPFNIEGFELYKCKSLHEFDNITNMLSLLIMRDEQEKIKNIAKNIHKK